MAESKDQALNPQNSEQVLSSINEWMVQQADAVKSTNPSIASEPSIKSSSSASQEHPIDPSKQANIPPGASSRSSFERQVFRTICGLLIAIVVAVVWQAYRDDRTMKLVKAWGAFVRDLVVGCSWRHAARVRISSGTEHQIVRPSYINAGSNVDTDQRIC